MSRVEEVLNDWKLIGNSAGRSTLGKVLCWMTPENSICQYALHFLSVIMLHCFNTGYIHQWHMGGEDSGHQFCWLQVQHHSLLPETRKWEGRWTGHAWGRYSHVEMRLDIGLLISWIDDDGNVLGVAFDLIFTMYCYTSVYLVHFEAEYPISIANALRFVKKWNRLHCCLGDLLNKLENYKIYLITSINGTACRVWWEIQMTDFPKLSKMLFFRSSN